MPALVTQGVSVYALRMVGLYDYGHALARFFGRDEDVCVVEHDIESQPGFLASYEACPEPWCWHPYDFGNPWHMVAPSLPEWWAPLGHARFRARFVTQAVRDELATRVWEGIDGQLARLLRHRGILPHLHEGKAMHHHPYPRERLAGWE